MEENKTLVERILAGDQNAFEKLIKKYQKLVAHIVFRMVTNTTDREDLCQEVFIKVYRSLGNFRFDSKLSTWIARIAYNNCLNFLEKKKIPLFDDLTEAEITIEQATDDSLTPHELTEGYDLNRILNEELENLPVQYKTIITLYHLDEMSYNEIGNIMGLSGGTVKSYLFRARRALREKLEAKYSSEELWH